MKIPTPTKTASGAYRIQLRLGGKSVTIVKETAAECKREAIAVKADHMTGRVVQKKCTLTVSDAIDKYIAKRTKLSPSTVRGYKNIQKNIFTPVMMQVLDTVDWQTAIDADTHAPKTIRNAWGFIASVLMDNSLPVPKVRLPAVISRERPFLQPSQIPTFLAAIKGQRIELAALLGLHSLRRSEILDVTYADVDLKAGVIHVRGAAVVDENNTIVHKTTNKNATSTRDVPIMIPRFTELVKQHKGAKTDYLVPLEKNTIWRDVNRICRENGLPEVGCHGLRHSFVSLAWHLKWDELSTMRVAGYADFQTMRKIYTHLAEADKKANVQSMSAFFTNSV